MTSITRNLPWFIREPAVSIIGENCYAVLIEELDIFDVPCLKYAASKGLGLGIVAGGSIMKIPQVMLILTAKSARGLSLPAYILETLSYGITTVYSVRHDYPFSTYGENFFLSLQNILITLLIIQYSGRSRALTSTHSNNTPKLIIAAFLTVVSAYSLYAIPMSTLQALQISTLPLSVFSKLPQISQNYKARSTGQLSAFAVIAQIAGCVARVFTTATELGDRIVLAGFIVALFLNIILGFQMWMYWGQE
ncbi:mannose-P-dolichol utilization defect 1 protein, partial [Sistotremastrum niveocremeum HHB9708]